MKPKYFKNLLEIDYITEKDLNDIFQMQYNDIFHNILKYDKNKMMMLLQEQVYLNLKLINKSTDYSFFQHCFTLFLDKYSDDRDKVFRIYQIIKKNPDQIIYLDYLNCFIHCTKCKNALHRCGQNFIVYNDYVFCLSCKEVYNEFQVHMYCKECKEQYFTKLREIKNQNEIYYFPVAYEKYHCPKLGFEEKIKCNKCKNDLYLDINSSKNKNKINEIFCKKCKIIYDVNKINHICNNCKCDFKSKAKIFNFFPQVKVDLLTVIHSLFNRKFALPLIIENKQCRCDLSHIDMLKHSDGGDLLEGDRFDKKVIVCNKCFCIFNFENFEWACPKCKREIRVKKRNIFDYKHIDQNYINNKYKKFVNYETLDNIKFYNSPMIKKYEKSKLITDSNINKKFLTNNNIKNNFNKIKDLNNRISSNYKNEEDKETDYKSSKSVGIVLQRGKSLHTNSKNYRKIELNEKYYTRNDKRNELSNRKDDTKEFSSNYSNSNYTQIIHISNIHSLNNHLSNKINLKKIDIEEKSDNKKSLYNSKNEQNFEKINRIKKNLFLEPNDNNEEKIIRKNMSVKNNLIIKSNKDKIRTSKSMFRKNEEKAKQIKKLNEIIKENVSINNKCNKKIHYIKVINIDNKNINNKNKTNNKNIHKIKIINCEKKNINNSNNNISIEIKINNHKNNFINVKNNYINCKSQRPSNYKAEKKNLDISQENRINDNYFNLNKSIQEKSINNSQRKNHMYFVSDLNNSNRANSNRKTNNKIIHNKLGIPQIRVNQNEIKNDLYKSQILDLHNHFNLKAADILIKNQKKQISPPIKNVEKKAFHSDDYNIISLIGEGTYGTIYLVKKHKTNEVYALKQISLKNKIDSNKRIKEFEFLMKLTEENPNLNIIKILGIEIKQLDKFNTVLYILMEAGKSDWEKEIYKRNLEQNYYTEEELIDILTSLVSTFSSLEEKGISHRDVKPQNIVFFEKNKNASKNMYKITDFGEAKINKNGNKNVILGNFEKNTAKQTVRGTELYMSPLLFNALRKTGEIDIQYNPFKSDVYSLGLCILLAACLSYIPLYQIREINSMDKIKNIIEGYLQKIYSKKFIDLLLVMLQINEKFRPDFIELNSWISNHYKKH